MAQEFSPTEIFKRATAATLRAIAERDDLTVGFGPEPAGLSGARVRLPNPPRDLPAEEAAQLRGAADSVALRLRYHDDAVHSKRLPGSPLARAVFEAVEQARVEALGARRMAGVAANLAAMLDEQYRRQGFERITERTDSTMAEAVRLLTREALTREPPPPSARRVVDLWRPWLEGRIGKDFGELDRTILDQDAYARATRRLLQDLDLDLGDADDQAESDEQEGGEEAEGENQSEGRGRHRRRAGLARRLADGRRGRGRAGRRRSRRRRDDARLERRRPGPPRPPRASCRAAAPTRPRSIAPSARFRRGHRRRQAVRPRRAVAAAPTARPAALASAERDRAARQPPAAPPDGQADPRLGVRSRGGPARRRAAVARRRQPDPAARLQARARDRVPRHRRHPADRQFGLDARPADHRGGDERRHPRAHP